MNEDLIKSYASADKVMLKISFGLFIYALALASWYNTWLEAILIGGGSAAVLTLVYSLSKGSQITRAAFAAGFMIFTALHIHQSHGMIEMHFGVFALLAVLLYYRDAMPILVAATLIIVHHLAFFYLQASGNNIYVVGSTDPGIWVIFLHAGYVMVETILLTWFAITRKREAKQSMEIMKVTNSILSGDRIDLSIRTSGDTELLSRFDSYTSNIDSLAAEVQKRANQLSEEGLRLGDFVEKFTHATHTQQQETTFISSATSEMTDAIRDVSDNAVTAAKATGEVDEYARNATQVSLNTKQAVKQLAENVREAEETIENLNAQATSIGSVLGVIRGVAEQTNLLALNAAIEAARAGESGRGFAVVADEVRTLALRTQQSTQEIDELIETLQSGSQGAVNIIAESKLQAEKCVQNTTESLALMEHVSTSIQDVKQMNNLIATAANEQSKVVEEINNNISNILDAVINTKQDAEQSSITTQTLLEISETLIRLTHTYKTTALE